jgi:hypothetical protein
MTPKIINKIWLVHQRKHYKQFQRNLSNCKDVQENILMDYLRENSSSDFGKFYEFNKIKNYSDYSQAIPIIEDFSEIQRFIDDISIGKNNVLFSGAPLFFESTSGSSSSSKLIPYNNALKSEFNTAISVWMWNLNQLDPKIFSGKSYWSLSPPLKEKTTTISGIPIGVDDDSDYLDPLSSLLLKKIFALPRHINKITNPNEFYLQTWKHLINCQNLSFISIWSPQFLIRLFQFMIDNFHEISKISNLSFAKKDTIKGAIYDNKFNLKLLFPNLRLISCWTHAQSKLWLNQLNEIAGQIPIQGKGLLSTEGVVSIPFGINQHILSFTSHFYEFKDQQNAIYTADQLDVGNSYEVILTTGAGLYRYNTHDLVKCTGFYQSVPCLEFLGRSGNVSDLVGEKLSENNLIEIFFNAYKRYQWIDGLFIFPQKINNSIEYVLIIQGFNVEKSKIICEFVEEQLLKNPYYSQALKAGQLNKLKYIDVEADFTKKLTIHYQNLNKIKDGDLKLPVLFRLGFMELLLNQNNNDIINPEYETKTV